jgi:hypothetical protein
MISSYNNYKEIILILLSNGARKDIKDKFGKRAINRAKDS